MAVVGVYRPSSGRASDLGLMLFGAGRCLPGGGGDEPGEAGGGVGAHARQQVLVGVDGEGRVGVAEAFGDDLDRRAGGDEQRGVGVAEVVEPDPRQPERATTRPKGWLTDSGLRNGPVVLENIQASGPWGSPSCRSRYCQRRGRSAVVSSRPTLRRLVRVLAPNSTAVPPRFWMVRWIDSRRSAGSCRST